MKKTSYLAAYAVAGAMFILFEYLHLEWIALGTKALLIPLLFVFSDSLIAVNRFAWSFDAARAIIMSTYLAAQFFIVYGILKEPESQ